MARRKTRTRYRTRTRTVYRRARGGGGKMQPIIDGALAGAVAPIVGNYVGSLGSPLTYMGIGWFRKNNTLTTLGAIQLGNQLGSMFTGGSGTGNGGFFQS